MKQLALRSAQAATLVALLGLWEVAARRHWVDVSLMPPPSRIAADIAAIPLDPSFWMALVRTLGASMLGLAIAAVIGVPAGILIGASGAVYRATRVLVDMCRSFPVVALMPVMVLLLGATPKMLVTVALLATVWPILLQSSYGARSVEPVIIDTARAFRIPRHLRFSHVMLPTSAPFIATGIRIAASFSLLVTIGVELLSATPGLGREIAQAQEGADFPLVMAYVFYCGLLGLLLNTLLSLAEHRLLGWQALNRGVR